MVARRAYSLDAQLLLPRSSLSGAGVLWPLLKALLNREMPNTLAAFALSLLSVT